MVVKLILWGDIGSGGQQHFRNLCGGIFRGYTHAHERCPPLVIASIDIRPGGQQHAHDVRISMLASMH